MILLHGYLTLALEEIVANYNSVIEFTHRTCGKGAGAIDEAILHMQ